MQLEIQNEEIISKARNAVINHDDISIKKVSQQILDEGMDPFEIIEFGFIEGMKELGDLFEQGEIQLQDIIDASATMHIGINILKPFMNVQESIYMSEDLALWV